MVAGSNPVTPTGQSIGNRKVIDAFFYFSLPVKTPELSLWRDSTDNEIDLSIIFPTSMRERSYCAGVFSLHTL